jgi:hypothetical protein
MQQYYDFFSSSLKLPLISLCSVVFNHSKDQMSRKKFYLMKKVVQVQMWRLSCSLDPQKGEQSALAYYRIDGLKLKPGLCIYNTLLVRVLLPIICIRLLYN